MATDAGRYVQLIAERRDEDAFLEARALNPFASVCGRVCAPSLLIWMVVLSTLAALRLRRTDI